MSLPVLTNSDMPDLKPGQLSDYKEHDAEELRARAGNWSFYVRKVSISTLKLLHTLRLAKEFEVSPKRLFELLPMFNPLFQSPTTGARHDGTNASHHFAPYDFVSQLLDKSRALCMEIFVGEADKWVDTAKGECLAWMKEECSAQHSVDANLDHRLGLRVYYVYCGTDIRRHSTGELFVCSS